MGSYTHHACAWGLSQKDQEFKVSLTCQSNFEASLGCGKDPLGKQNKQKAVYLQVSDLATITDGTQALLNLHAGPWEL